MQFTVSPISKARIEINFEVSSEELEQHKQAALAELAKEVTAEGFRQGTVPLAIVEQRAGQQVVLNETAKVAMTAAYQEAIEKDSLDVLGEPEVEIKKFALGNPFEFVLRVDVLPPIELPDYKAIAAGIERKPVTLEEKDIESALQWLRESRKGEDGSIPELTDEFAKSLGAFTTVEELKASLKDGLQQEKEMQESQRVRQEIIDTIAKEATLEIPEALLAHEKQEMLEETKRGVSQMLKIEFPEYLQKVNKTEEELVNSFQEEAEKRVKRSLVLREITRNEQIEAEPQEIEEQITKALAQYPNPEEARKQIDPDRLTQYMKDVIENEKTFQFLEGFAQKQQ